MAVQDAAVAAVAQDAAEVEVAAVAAEAGGSHEKIPINIWIFKGDENDLTGNKR